MTSQDRVVALVNASAASLAAHPPTGIAVEDLRGYQPGAFYDAIAPSMGGELVSVRDASDPAIALNLNALVLPVPEETLAKIGLSSRTYAVKLLAVLNFPGNKALGDIIRAKAFDPWHFALDYLVMLHSADSLVTVSSAVADARLLTSHLLASWAKKSYVTRVRYLETRLSITPFTSADEVYFAALMSASGTPTFLESAVESCVTTTSAPLMLTECERTLISFCHPRSTTFAGLDFDMLITSIPKHPNSSVVRACFVHILMEHYGALATVCSSYFQPS
jgi:hypothetical protein